MSEDLSNIDPAWAWSPYAPTPQRPWTLPLAAHLQRRAAFGATWTDLNEAVNQGPQITLDRLCDPPPPSHDLDQSIQMLGERTMAGGDAQRLASWWLYRMRFTSDPLLEKLTLFWHGHFATSAAKVPNSRLMAQQNQLLRSHARGKFELMVKAVSRDPAMLLYLDAATNRRVRPNENYARELMELFCLGVGNYTERDIREMARAFTGWEVRADTFGINPSQHDTRPKTFLGKTGDFDGDDAIRIVLDHPAAPRFIARKLVRHFVLDEPELSDPLIEPLAADLRQRDFEIAPVVRRILSSNFFFSDHAIARKIRAPIDLAMGLLRSLGATANLVRLAQDLAELGQSLFYPPNVKGWDGGRAWINSSTLLARSNLVRRVLTSSQTSYADAGGSLAALAERCRAQTAEQIVLWLSDTLLAAPLPSEARQILLRQVAAEPDANQRIVQAIITLITMPEFNLA